jgi:protein transport protein SEC24
MPLKVEFKQGDNLHLQGVTEYGYGYWSRFVYLGELG